MNLLSTITRAFQGKTDEALEEEIQRLQGELSDFQSAHRISVEDAHEGLDAWLADARSLSGAHLYPEALATNGRSLVTLWEVVAAWAFDQPSLRDYLREQVEGLGGQPGFSSMSREERDAELARRQAEIDKRRMELERRRLDHEAKEAKRHLADLRERAAAIGSNGDEAA